MSQMFTSSINNANAGRSLAPAEGTDNDWSPQEETLLRKLVTTNGEGSWKQKAKQLRARSWYSYYCTDTRSAEACRSKWRRMRLDTARADMRGLEEAIESMVPRIEERFHSAEQLDPFADKLDLKVQEYFEYEIEAMAVYATGTPACHCCV